MIKFFRKIRQRLLSENKFSKYLIYAIGEVILVVIGILIALQINNWNQVRINSSKEKSYLTYLKKELTENSELNQRMIINRMDTKMEGLNLAKNFCENNFEITDTLGFLNKITIGGLFSGGSPLGVRNYYNELLNTGNMQLIKNESIKLDIARYYSRIEYYTKRSSITATQYANFNDELRPFKSDNPDHISKYDQIEMIQAFKSDEFRRLVDAEISYAYAIFDGAKSLESRAKAIIELIDMELNKNQSQ